MLATTVEGRAQPCLSHRADIPAERDLPLTISRAITRTMTWRDGEFGLLGRTERSMLVEVLRCIPKGQPQEGAFIRRDTLAVRMDCSLATITRLLARLEELGWILRDQVKSRIRGFQVGSIALTQAAMGWLGFDTPLPQAERCAPMSDASRLSNQSLRRQPPQAEGPVEESASKQAKLRAESRLPAGLRWLLDKVSPWGIFKLMGEARKRGLLLEDVASQCREQIGSAQNGFAYVQGLLNLDKDWAYIADQRRADVAAADAQLGEKLRLSEAIDGLEGRRFVGADGDIRLVQKGWVVVYAASEAAKLLGTPKGSSPVSFDFLSSLDRGDMRPWTPSSPPQPQGPQNGVSAAQPSAAADQRLQHRGATHASQALAQAFSLLRTQASGRG